MSEKKIRCLHCDTEMENIGQETLQLGQTSFLFGHLSNLLSGGLNVQIWRCPSCGKLEFFSAEAGSEISDNGLTQRECPHCGKQHDFYDTKCPFCGYDYYLGR